MTDVVTDTDLRAMSDLLALADRSDTSYAGLPDEVLAALSRLVRADFVSFTDFDVASRTEYLDQEFDGDRVHTEGEHSGADSAFWEHYWTTLCCSYASRTGDDRTVTKISDFYTLRQWRTTPMYAECHPDYTPDHELICCLPTVGTRSRRVIFFRGRGPDFDERDRMLMALLRPHLQEIHARGSKTGGSRLTTRQLELLRLVAAGRSTREIADVLFLSPGTVRKHLDNIFARLEVTTRAAAVARALTD